MAIFSPKKTISADDLSVECLVGRAMTQIDGTAAPSEWVFHFGDRCLLNVGGTWRAAQDGRIAIAGDDHNQLFGHKDPVDAGDRLGAIFGSRTVSKAGFDGLTGDLRIWFGERTWLEVLTDSSGYESWTLLRPDGTLVVAMGGGEVVPLTASGEG